MIKLRANEAELRGDEKGKYLLILSLNSNIEKLKLQLGTQREYHTHENFLQSVVDHLTAKKLELEEEHK